MAIYMPRHFAVADQDAINRVVREFGFATLISRTADDVLVSHVPVLVEGSDAAPAGAIIGHVAAANPHSVTLSQGAGLLVFNGPDDYVSPNWYGEPAAAVPTWNYVAVHVRGKLE